MNCITEFISYYYNLCIPARKKSNKKEINPLSNIEQIDNTYDLVFLTSKNALQKLNIVLYNIYTDGICVDNKIKSSVFLYNNNIYKIVKPKDFKNYINVLNTIKNYSLKNILLPENVYYNKYQNETVQIYKYFKDGDLFDYFSSKILNNDEIYYIFNKIVNIVNELHRVGLVHRDLKLENFLIYYKNNNLDICLIDLDFTIFNNKNFTFSGGTEYYASYEITNNISIINWNSSDIWSLGVILYILLFRQFPWKNSSKYEYTFKNYTYNYHKHYWYNKLDELNLCESQQKIYANILNYTFNLDYIERCDIKVIKSFMDNKS